MDAFPGGARWPILMAFRAIRQLQKLQQDQKVLDIVQKKIKELSNGKFTFENHRMIIGTAEHIPMYRARLANDLRILYQIDIESETSNPYDRQVIRIFAVQPRAQVDYSFWPKVSRHLAGKGGEYRRKCIFRLSKETCPNTDCFPAMFPHKDYQLVAAPRVGDDESGHGEPNNTQAELQETIGLERYLPFSKALHNSILADVEVHLPVILDSHEREIVNHTKATIVVGRSGTGKTTALMYRMRAIEQLLKNYADGGVRQLFVTRSPVLVRHVESTYRKLNESVEMASKTRAELHVMASQAKQSKDTALVEFDNSVDLRQDLPSQFSLLDDSHFPLFISFDKLCSLLEGDLPLRTYKAAGKDSRRKLIGYDEFREQYWPCLNKELTPLVNPVLVYSEIMGIIKGSSTARESECGCLSRIQYTEQLCYRVLSQLTTATREVIYSLFGQYKKLKAERFELDWADRTCYILDHLDEYPVNCPVDYLYVDEVQDNLMLDVHLLRKLCPQIRGTYWGGDTAQTIVAGSAFRIKELKSFVYCDIQSDQSPFAPISPSSLFTTFELTTNFRSHTGIVNCAASIVESVYRLFPNSIDRMPPETARVWGPPPILFTDSNDDISFFKGFVLGSNPSSQTGFGAQQAILVRSDALAEELESKLHGLCPVISIVNCKGLEFDDILIYNFFAQSAASFEDWQFVTGLPEHKRKRAHELVVPPVLCLELKLLYVAITRARKRCWIWDSGEIYNAMKSHLLDRELVSITSATRMIGRIGVSSTPAQWTEKGREYFSHGLYKYASACFNHAGREQDANVASAYHRMSRAKLELLRRDNHASHIALVEAAQNLRSCIIGPSDQNAKHLWFHAGSCLELARQFISAADAFVEGGFHTRAIGLLFENECYDYGSKLLLAHWDHLEPSAREPLLDGFRQHFFEIGNYEYLSLVFWDDVEAQLVYARKNGYIPQLKWLLKIHERFDELSELYLGELEFPTRVEYSSEAFRVHHPIKRVQRAAQNTIDYARTVVLLEGRYREIPRRTLTNLVTVIFPYSDELDPESRKWIKFLHALVTKTAITLDDARTWNSEIPSENGPQILALHFALLDMDWLSTDSLSLVIRYLHAWSLYAPNILQMAQNKEPSSSKLTQMLLGLRNPDLGSRSPTHIQVSEDSLVLEAARRDGAGITRSNAWEHLLPTKIADRIIESEVTTRLCGRVHTLVSRVLGSRWTTAPFPIVGGPQPNPFPQPVAENIVSKPQFKMRLYVVVYAMRSLKPVGHLVLNGGRHSVGQLLAGGLHNTVYPLNGMEENVSLISSLPDQASLTGEVLAQIRDELIKLDPKVSRPVEFFTSLIRNLALTALLDRQMLDHYHNQKCSFKHLTEFTRRHGCSIRTQSLAVDLLQFFRAWFPDSLSRGIYALQHILDSDMGMDATTLVHLSELITREIIFSSRAATSAAQDGFAGIILPFSWARSLAKTRGSSKVVRHPWPLDTFLQALHRLASEIKFGVLGRWTVGGAWLCNKPDVVHLLNLRLCWCAALLALNFHPGHAPATSSLQTLRDIANNTLLSGYPRRHSERKTPYDIFSKVNDHAKCLQILCKTLSHERVVLLLDGREAVCPAKLTSDVQLIRYTKPSVVYSVLLKMA